MQQLKPFLLTLWGLIITFALYYFFTHDITVESLQGYFSNLGAYGAIAYIIAYAIRPIVFFPTSIMTPLSVVLFGPYLGWIFTYIGETFSASVAFFLARFFGRTLVKNNENSFLKKYDHKLTNNGFQTVLFLRFVPLFPFDFVNYTCGLSGIRYKDYLIATLLGVIPGLTAYIFLGSSLTDPRFLIPTILSFILLSVFAKYVEKKYGKKV
ncbi:hypothetical protein COB57_02940 [Candidatus Peregrinibacteria bacterium]|nr:MAG: hypothetical protein COB57_02940 [Candidatus Peregrinibacteria bacterium]